MFSKSCEYGIRALIYIGTKCQRAESPKISLQEIAHEIGSPEAFTAKILQLLVRESIVSSIKGPNGGFYISREQLTNVKLKQIVKAIDGEKIMIGCGLGLQECSEEKPCPLHHQFKFVKKQLNEMLDSTSLADLANGNHAIKTYLKI